MKVYKDDEHSVTLHPFGWPNKRYLMICVGLYVSFNPESGETTLRNDQEFWEEAPIAFANLGVAPTIDLCLPKPGGEVLVAGLCRTPHKEPLEAMEASFEVGTVARTFAVFGDRQLISGDEYTSPLPFSAMPLRWDKAFGGANFAANPHGKGLDEQNDPGTIPPNVEDPNNLLLNRSDILNPVCPYPIGLDNPKRRALSGTYDENWINNVCPAYPDDLNPEFFYSAQKAQRLYQENGQPAFFCGDEKIAMHGMHHDYPSIVGQLPGKRIRAFVETTQNFIPFDAPKKTSQSHDATDTDSVTYLPYEKDYDAEGIFRECTLNCDTVWLFPDILGAFVMYRGLLPVEDDEMDDILRVLVVSENSHEPAQSLEYYRDELQKRIFPTQAEHLASLQENQKVIAKALKTSSDLPKKLAKARDRFQGKSPRMPFSIDDIAKSGQRTFAQSKKTLNALEEQLIEMKKELGQTVNLNKINFTQLRQQLTEQEQRLAQNFDKVRAELKDRDQKLLETVSVGKRLASDWAKFQGALESLDLQVFEKAENMTSDKLLEKTKSINPWHDAGFALVIEARRALLDAESALSILEEHDIAPETIDDAWLGVLHKPFVLIPSAWGLDASLAEQILPAGLVLPRFDEEKLIALSIYPLQDNELITDKDSIALALGSYDETPIFLPASQAEHIFLIVPCHLSAIFAEQEVGDFCHIIVADEPSKVENLDNATLIVLLPCLAQTPEGNDIFSNWKQVHPQAKPLFLPEQCKHILDLNKQKKLFRPLVLEKLPQNLAEKHNLGLSIIDEKGSAPTFTLNLPIHDEQAMEKLLNEHHGLLRADEPNPRQELLNSVENMKKRVLKTLQENNASQEMTQSARNSFEKFKTPQIGTENDAPLGVLKHMKQNLSNSANSVQKTGGPAEETVIEAIKKAQSHLDGMFEKFASLETIYNDGLKTQQDLLNGAIPEKLSAMFTEHGMNPANMKVLNRADVEQILATSKDFTRKNMSDADVSGLDFSDAIFDNTICNKTNFQDCSFKRASFNFMCANYTNFSHAQLQETTIIQSSFDFANFADSDLSKARIELTNFHGVDASGANFAEANMELTGFEHINLSQANFTNAQLSLTSFKNATANDAHFDHLRAFKCSFSACKLTGASFQNATLEESIFLGVQADGVSFVGTDLRKFYTESESNFQNANFQNADLRNASLRMSYFRNADFYQARLDNAFFAHCNMQKVHIDGVQAMGCRFRKCDLNKANLSYSNFMGGDFFKSRLNAANLDGANLFNAHMDKIHIDQDTSMQNTNLKKTILSDKADVLAYIRHKNS